MIDEYRATLFKKKLREIFQADWVRFYWTTDKTHLCLDAYHHGRGNLLIMRDLLKKHGIEYTETWDRFRINEMLGDTPELDELAIPIDQEALPERRKARKEIAWKR